MSKKLSIDEAARRLCDARFANFTRPPTWRYIGSANKEAWRGVALLARKLFEQPAKKQSQKKPAPPACEACGKSKRSVRRRTTCDGRRFNSCERCWCHIPADVFDRNVEANRAKANAAKKARK